MPEPTENCPYCEEVCYADWVSTGFSSYDVQAGPFYCTSCKASQIGPCDVERDLTPEEKKTGWYRPGAPLGSSVNAIGGVPIDTQTARTAYEIEYDSGTPVMDTKSFRPSCHDCDWAMFGQCDFHRRGEDDPF